MTCLGKIAILGPHKPQLQPGLCLCHYTAPCQELVQDTHADDPQIVKARGTSAPRAKDAPSASLGSTFAVLQLAVPRL